MTITLALAGDTMLGRRVAERASAQPAVRLFAGEVIAAAREADLFVLNLECCISAQGEPWPDPAKPFFFRAPPVAVDVLVQLGVNAVTLANNHALDYGPSALADTLHHLATAGIACVGAGMNTVEARAPAVLDHRGERLAVLGLTDHPADFAAGPDRPGTAYADLRGGLPHWVRAAVAEADADAVLVTPHWGPNMTTAPVPHVRAAARALSETRATVVAGHSAHVFHGVDPGPPAILYDLGDFVDDYAVDPQLRNDLGLLWFVHLQCDRDDPVGGSRVSGVEALPLALDFCHTRLAEGAEVAWLQARLAAACAEFGTAVTPRDGRLALTPLD